MQKLFVVFMLLALIACAGGNRYLPPEAEQNIRSVSDTSKCTFIKNTYYEAQAHTLVYYAQLNTYNAGGDSYKIVSNTQERVMGVNIHMINIEIWKCKESGGSKEIIVK